MDIALRRLIPEDATVIAPLINNKKVWDNLRDKIPHPYSGADGAFFVARTEMENPFLTFGITSDDTLCGVIGFILQKDIFRYNAEIGYWLGEPFWGRGIAIEAVHLATDYGFQHLGLVRIQAGVMAHNPASMRVLEKNGYELEGIFKKAIFKNGIFVDEYRYGRIADT